MVRLYWSLKGDLLGPSVSLECGETWGSCQTLSHCRADCHLLHNVATARTESNRSKIQGCSVFPTQGNCGARATPSA